MNEIEKMNEIDRLENEFYRQKIRLELVTLNNQLKTKEGQYEKFRYYALKELLEKRLRENV